MSNILQTSSRTTEPVDHDRAMQTLATYWAHGGEPGLLGGRTFRIADTPGDQPVPQHTENPYWSLIRHYPAINDAPWRGVTPFSYPTGLPFGREALVRTYSWSIPSPGDVTWMAALLAGRGVVEIGAGTGYWAWQFAQAGVDVVAYEPCPAADNKFIVVDQPYHPLTQDDASAAARHHDRALFVSWPDYGGSWATQALSCYQGDLLIYAGEMHGGCCADDDFFTLLDKEWVEIGASRHHYTWWGINDQLTAYRRAEVAAP